MNSTTLFSLRVFTFLFAIVLLSSCGQPEPRRPIQQKTGKYFGANLERNKVILAQETKLIKAIIAKDSLHHYEPTASGSWFYYVKKNDSASYMPQPNDLVTLAYNVMSLENDTIYTGESIGIKKYKVDMEELFPGLRNSVKILKVHETATFLFPSSLGFGYPGDGDKIGINVPLKSTISILKIEKEHDSIQAN